MSADELVALYDPDDRIDVHRRTDTKDVYPGAWDAWAGGVVRAGEDPAAAAARELAEGRWMTTDEVCQLLADAARPFILDGRFALEQYLAMADQR